MQIIVNFIMQQLRKRDANRQAVGDRILSQKGKSLRTIKKYTDNDNDYSVEIILNDPSLVFILKTLSSNICMFCDFKITLHQTLIK